MLLLIFQFIESLKIGNKINKTVQQKAKMLNGKDQLNKEEVNKDITIIKT